MNLPLIVGSYLLLSNGQPVDTAFFENRVRPVLVEHCGKCHGIGEGAKVKGGLRLDSRQALLTGGDNGPAIVLGKPENSRLVTALEYLDTDLQMLSFVLPDTVKFAFKNMGVVRILELSRMDAINMRNMLNAVLSL